MLNLRIGDGTHHKKRHAVRTRGETPIEKNVAVTDEKGNTYQPTYLRRAKGLVKHGRARWMDDNRICLSCPPEQIREISEDDMDDIQVTYIKEQIEFLKTELKREVFLNGESEFQPEAAAKIEESRNELRKKMLELLDKLADPQSEERRVQEKQYYRSLLEKISTNDAALSTAEDVAGQCDDDDVRREIFTDVAMAYERTKLDIAKLILEKLA